MDVCSASLVLGRFGLVLALALGVLPAAAQVVPMAPEAEPEIGTTLFQIVVLVGGQEDKEPGANVPANATKALDDIRQFLPYKSYRMVDMALIRSLREGRGLMAGPDGEDYIVEFSNSRTRRARILVEGFKLTDGDRQKNQVLIDTSFEVTMGETIVVGSSKLGGGDEGLIVLFTAIQ